MPPAVPGLIDVIDVERVDSVSVPTRDLARSRRFYGELLGLPRRRSNPNEFEAANVTLTLWQPKAQNVPFSPNTAGIALRVARFVGAAVSTCSLGLLKAPGRGGCGHATCPSELSVLI
jgi:catechol 2,3-dioxygenase-like lactoylglutathione lyase family enzyme